MAFLQFFQSDILLFLLLEFFLCLFGFLALAFIFDLGFVVAKHVLKELLFFTGKRLDFLLTLNDFLLVTTFLVVLQGFSIVFLLIISQAETEINF
jgi:hypothetical protein